MSPHDPTLVLEDAIGSASGLTELTTAPTPEQREAMRAIDEHAIASSSVCGGMGLPLGSTWGAVLMEIRSRHDRKSSPRP